MNVLLGVFFTNQDKDGIYYPLFGRENKKAYEKIKDQLKPANPMKPELHTPEQIKLMLTSLSRNPEGQQALPADQAQLSQRGQDILSR